MSVCGTGIWGVPEPINPDLNASALTATAGTLGIYVRWTLNELALPGVSHTRLYRGTTAEYALATPLQNIKGDYYFDAINDIADPITYYYWIRHIAVDGQIGNLIGPAAATFNGAIQAIIERLSGQLDETHLSASLKTDIDTIAILAESLAQETIDRTTAYQLLTEALATASGDFDDVRTAIIQEVNSRQTADSAQIESINAFGIRVGDAEGAIIDEAQLRVDGDEANASLITGLTTRMEDAEGAISIEATTRAEEDQALAQLITNLDVSIDGKVAAAISDADLVAANGYCEIGGNPSTTILTEDACTGSGGTWISTGQMAASNKTFVTQTNNSISGLNGTVGEHTDSIGSLQTTMGVATGQLGQIKVHYMVKLSASAANGKQLIGGFGLYNDGTTIDAGFEVDRFWIGRSVMGGGSVAAVKPFMVDGGTVYMDTAVIKNASITDAKIGNLSADKITAGTLHAMTLTSGTFRTSPTASGKRIEARSSDNSLSFYDAGNVERVRIDTSSTDGTKGHITLNAAGSDYGLVVGSAKVGIYATGSTYAIDGYNTNATAIRGRTRTGIGVYGHSEALPPLLQGSGTGVKGETVTGNGVLGIANGGGKGGYFISYAGIALTGISQSGSGHGVWGESAGGYGVFGTSSGWAGVYGVGNGSVPGVAGSSANGRAIQGIGTGAGSIGLYGQGVAYGAYIVGAIYSFTGAHDCLLLNGDTVPEVGDIMEIVSIVNKSSVSETISRVQLTTTAESKKVYGVFVRSIPFPDYVVDGDIHISIAGLNNLNQTDYETILAGYTLLGVNGVGEGQINVCSANGDFEVGDFICTSAVPGKGQRYDGNDMRVVVAKCLEPVDWSTEPETTKMVACIYMCS